MQMKLPGHKRPAWILIIGGQRHALRRYSTVLRDRNGQAIRTEFGIALGPPHHWRPVPFRWWNPAHPYSLARYWLANR